MKNNNELSLILKCSEKEAYFLKHPFIGTEHLILSILKTDNEIKQILNEDHITYNNYKEELKKTVRGYGNVNNLIYTPLLKKILFSSAYEFSIKNIFLKILEEGEGIGITILTNLNLDVCALYSKLKSAKDFNFGIDLVALAKEEKLNKVIGRDKEVSQIIEILGRKNKCNPLLIGEAGVGKTAIVEGLASRIINNDVPQCLKNCSIISLSMSSLVSGTKYRGEFEEKLEKIIKQLSLSKNKILFIDEIHTLIGAGGAEGAIDASNILKPYLARNTIKCIGSTTITEYNKSIRNDKALDRRFCKIIVNEPNKTDVKTILYGIKKDYEEYHNIKITNKELDYIVNMAEKEIGKHEPDRSIDLLDTVCTKASLYLKSSELTKLNYKLDEVSKLKTICLNSKNFYDAYKYKKEEICIKNKMINYRPKITIKFINEITNKVDKNNIIGFN